MTFYDLWVLAVLTIGLPAFITGCVLLVRDVFRAEGHGTPGEVVPLAYHRMRRADRRDP